MAELVTQDARALFTKMLVDVYQERLPNTGFLRGFFPTVVSPTKEISIEVERGFEKVAVDVVRGTEGNRNTFSRSTEKVFIPPFYREFFDATLLDLYDRVLGSQGNAQTPLFTALLSDVANRLGRLQDKIERAYELQCAQVLLTGIVTLSSGLSTTINYQRKSTSLVDLGAGNYFANNSDCFGQFETACTFLRQVGKSGDPAFVAICGKTALADLLKNTNFTNRQNLFNMQLDAVTSPVRNAQPLGATFHGNLTAGAFKVQLWSYPQFYDDPTTGVSTSYVDPKKIIVIPTQPRFKLVFAAVPQLVGQPGQMPTPGAYVMGEYLDLRLAAHVFDVKSAGVALPVAVDQIYTFKAVA